MAEELQMGEAADYRGEEVEVASCPLGEEVNPCGGHEVQHGPLGEEEAASMGEASHWGSASEDLPY